MKDKKPRKRRIVNLEDFSGIEPLEKSLLDRISKIHENVKLIANKRGKIIHHPGTCLSGYSFEFKNDGFHLLAEEETFHHEYPTEIEKTTVKYNGCLKFHYKESSTFGPPRITKLYYSPRGWEKKLLEI